MTPALKLHEEAVEAAFVRNLYLVCRGSYEPRPQAIPPHEMHPLYRPHHEPPWLPIVNRDST